jgi:phenylacetate-CoA ligase
MIETYAIRYYFDFQKSQLWPAEKLKNSQKLKLRSLLQHAYQHVHYYHRIFRERNLKPDDFHSVADLAKLPILDKSTIKQNISEFVAYDAQQYWPITTATGGSTGEPLQFFIDIRSTSAAEAVLWRGWGYAGFRLGDKMAVLAGLSLVPEKEALLKAAAKQVIKKTIAFPAMHINKTVLDGYVRRLLKFKPKFIRGYPSTIFFFANHLKEEKISGVYPKAVFTTAEMLLPYQKKLIEEVFQCEVFDGYGAFDGGTAAFECEEHDGYHICVEKTIMEFVDENNNYVAEGENGRIIATDLLNYAMPFIRYDTGDMGTSSGEECSCGRKLPLMKEILGRTADILRFKSGAVLFGPTLTLVFKQSDIKQYQVIQTGDDSVTVSIVKGRNYSDKDTEKMYKLLSSAVGVKVDVQFKFVESIPTTRRGKWRFVIKEAGQ